MNREAAISLLTARFPQFINTIVESHGDFMEAVPAAHRATLDATTRARYVQNRAMFHLLTTFGESGPIRLAAEDSLRYLFISGDPESAGVRWKKVGRYTLISSNHQSERQDALRATQSFLFGTVAHLIMGYTENEDDPLNPLLERIVLTCENSDGLDWSHPIWVAETATDAVKIDTGFEQEQLPLKFTVKPKKIAGAMEGTEQQKKVE